MTPDHSTQIQDSEVNTIDQQNIGDTRRGEEDQLVEVQVDHKNATDAERLDIWLGIAQPVLDGKLSCTLECWFRLLMGLAIATTVAILATSTETALTHLSQRNAIHATRKDTS